MQKLIYIDALNYASVFFPRGNDLNSISTGFKRIKEFCDAASSKGYKVKAFIDAAQISLETQKKWIYRKEKEIKSRQRSLPYGIDLLTSNAFQVCGIPVIYSLEIDNDDLVASLAQKDNAVVLSRDSDFFGFRESSFQVCSGFKICKNEGGYGFELQEADLIKSKAKEKRDLSVITNLISDYKSVNYASIKSRKLYKRGGESPLLKELGNPHLALRPLRQALYYRLGIDRVTEFLPIWNGGKIEWLQEKVERNGFWEPYLDTPIQAFSELSQTRPKYVSDNDWERLNFTVFAMTMEICSFAKDGGKSYYSYLIRHYKNYQKRIKEI